MTKNFSYDNYSIDNELNGCLPWMFAGSGATLCIRLSALLFEGNSFTKLPIVTSLDSQYRQELS